MNIQFVDLQRQNREHEKELMRAIRDVVLAATFIMGEPLLNFEKEFAQFCGKKYCIGTNSGTDALKLALEAYGIGRGDEVITCPNSYFSTAMVISELGAKPVFVDISKQSYTIDVSQIEKKISKKTKAIVPIHFAGQAADMDPIVAVAKKYHLTIIEDTCQAHGAEYKGKRLPYTETGAFSFYPGKNLGCFGDGGAVVTDSKEIKDRITLLRNDGCKKKYVHKLFGHKSRLDTLQAKILSIKLKSLCDWNEKRRRHAKLYTKLLANIPIVATPVEMDYAKHIYHLYMIETPNRNQLRNYLTNYGVATVIHYPIPIHLQQPYRNEGFNPGDFPVTEEKAQTILSLPMFPELTNQEIKYVCKKISDFFDYDL